MIHFQIFNRKSYQQLLTQFNQNVRPCAIQSALLNAKKWVTVVVMNPVLLRVIKKIAAQIVMAQQRASISGAEHLPNRKLANCGSQKIIIGNPVLEGRVKVEAAVDDVRR